MKYISLPILLVLIYITAPIKGIIECDPIPGTPANKPIGTARGHNPGRVTWAYTGDEYFIPSSWDGTTDFWWKDLFVDQTVVDRMLQSSLDALAGGDGDDPWNSLFTSFNEERGVGGGYVQGQKIAIKVNLNSNEDATNNNGNGVAPQTIKALVRQLVNHVGVLEGDIYVYDPSRYIKPSYINPPEGLGDEFPNLNLVDGFGGERTIKVTPDPDSNLKFSSPEVPSPDKTQLPTCATSAEYQISVSALRGHFLAGFTATGKNWFGSIYREIEGYSCVDFGWWCPKTLHSFVDVKTRGMGTYSPLVDLLGHEDLGGKCMLFMVDGLYGGEHPESPPIRWQMEPFDNGWTSSLFISQDPIALDSVIFDFARSEPELHSMMYEGDEIYCVDNYLHEGALAHQPPSGTIYSPHGKQLLSLGVHEHWNNAKDKQYSRNLGTGVGIELLKVNGQVRTCDPVPGTPVNSPIGVPRGINPGRVVWVHPKEPTKGPSTWDGNNDNYWWESKNLNLDMVKEMFRDSIENIGNTTDGPWDAIFRHFNKEHGNEGNGYKKGEKIAIKLNLNNNLTPNNTHGNGISPQLLKSLLTELVNTVGVEQSDIYIYDAARYVDKCYINPPEGIKEEFPGVNIMSRFATENTKAVEPSSSSLLIFSNKDVLGYEKTLLPTFVHDATYIISLGAFRGHTMAGFTATGKNWFGSVYRDVEGWDFCNFGVTMDFGFWCPWTLHDFVSVRHRPMGTYSVLVDLLGHRDLGDKCLLYIIDGMYGGQREDQLEDIDGNGGGGKHKHKHSDSTQQHNKLTSQSDQPVKFEMPPFNKYWTSSIFISQDPVALDSVIFDFLRNEPKLTEMLYWDKEGKNIMCADNYLHEAALADDPPSGTIYNPNNGRLGSLGVHEHWNNATDKKYSRDLGIGEGIQLLKVEYEGHERHSGGGLSGGYVALIVCMSVLGLLLVGGGAALIYRKKCKKGKKGANLTYSADEGAETLLD